MYLIINWFFHYGNVPELFRNSSGTKTEKLKNCSFQRDPGRDSPYKFSFSIFQFWFGNYSGIFAEKLKNCKYWKTVFSRDIQEEILHMDSVFLFFRFIASQGRNNCIFFFLRVSSLHVINFVYIIYIWCPPKRSSQNLEAKMCVKHCKYKCFCTKHRFWGEAAIYIYVF